MLDPFRRLFSRLDGGPVILTAEEWRDFGEDGDALAAAGLLAETTPATVIECAACDEAHSASVRAVTTAVGRPTRWFLHCPHVGAVQVDEGELRRWVVRVPALGRALTGRDAEERVPERVWRLGPIPVGSAHQVGWLVAGWRGKSGIADAMPELHAANAVVFVPHSLPKSEVWGTVPPAVVPLVEVIRVTGTGVEVNPSALAGYLPPEPAVVTETDTRPRLTLPAGTRWEDLTLVVGDHHVELRLGATRHEIGYEALGLADGRKGGPGAAWLTLTRLAEAGELTDGDEIDTKSTTLKNNVVKLRRALQRWTGLAGDPLPARRREPYRPRFTVRTAGTLKPA